MSLYEKFLKNRELGEVPISFGSSIPIQCLMGNVAETSNIAKQTKPDEYKISIRTLFRNMWSCIDKDGKYFISAELYADALVDEILEIKKNLRMSSYKDVKLEFYYPNYNYLKREFKHANFKELKTENDKKYLELEEKACKSIIENLDKINSELDEIDKIEIVECDGSIKSNANTIWITTHNVVDLLALPLTRTIRLFDSHTGKLRGHNAWTDKLTGSHKLERIPFNKMTIQVFGDRGRMFSPMKFSYKKFLLKLAEEKRWNKNTSIVSIKICLNGHPDRFSANTLLDLLK